MVYVSFWVSASRFFYWGSMLVHLPMYFRLLSPGPVLLLRSDAVASRIANGSAAFNWKLRCHWVKGLQQRLVALVIQSPGAGATSQSHKPLAPIPVNQLKMELWSHDDVIKWKPIPRHWTFVQGIHRSPVNYPHKGPWHGALMFSLIYAWING